MKSEADFVSLVSREQNLKLKLYFLIPEEQNLESIAHNHGASNTLQHNTQLNCQSLIVVLNENKIVRPTAKCKFVCCNQNHRNGKNLFRQQQAGFLGRLR